MSEYVDDKIQENDDKEHAPFRSKSLQELMADFVELVDKSFEFEDVGFGFSTGFDVLDEILSGGFLRKELVVIAGHPDSGRLDLAMNIIKSIALSGKKSAPVAYMGVNQVPNEISFRLVSSLTHIEPHALSVGYLTDEDWPRITGAISLLSEASLHILTTPTINVKNIRKRLIELKSDDPELAVLVINRLSFIDSGVSSEYTPLIYERIMLQLKELAYEMDVAVIICADFPLPKYESRPNKRPVLSDLSPNTSIYEYADRVLFLYRDECFDCESPDSGSAEVIVAKNMLGPVGTVRLAYMRQYHKFENMVLEEIEEEVD